MDYKKCILIILLLGFSVVSSNLCAQINNLQNRFKTSGNTSSKNSKDSLVHRDPLEDSITISFRYFDSTRIRKIDSSINDFYTRFPEPYYYHDLGNTGTPAHSLLFNPNMKPGFDAGFHAYDLYNYSVEGARFFQTTRPYTELAYLIGSNSEQLVNILHTQNRKSNFNAAFEYRFINSPGAFKNQNTSHNNIRVNSFFQSDNKRYGLYFIFINNKLKASENGGLLNDNELNNLSLGNPFEANTRLATGLTSSGRNLFNTNIAIGTLNRTNTLYLRHYYDFGQKDSVVTDSSTIKLFYPRLRLQHTISLVNSSFEYHDFRLDSSDYIDYFKYFPVAGNDTLLFKDEWRDLTNEFSLITFPDKKNVAQFLKLSAAYQLLRGTFSNGNSKSYNNIYVSGEYRNRTRNQKWEVEAAGQLYAAGGFTGDYSAYISLQRELSKKIGSLRVGFQNVNRSPTEISKNNTSFNIIPNGNYNKTNTSRLFATIYLPLLQLQLTGNYYAVTNYLYFDDFYTVKQYSPIFNLVNISLQKQFRLAKHINWYTDVYYQQAPGNPPVHLPVLFTRNRFAFEGNFFKNLFLSTGIEFRYNTPYKADSYSPVSGQFFYQNDSTISNRPDINVYLNFRIKSFKAFVRLENLNTLDKTGNQVGFLTHNFSAVHYPQNALWLRIGIWWSFVN